MEEKIMQTTRLLKNPKLYTALEAFMFFTGRRYNRFAFSEELSKRLNEIRLVIKDEEDCYTDFKSISIGTYFPYFTDNINETFNIAKGVLGHEIAHIYFTSKAEWDKFTQTSRGKYRRLASVANDILNIVEDDRIEYWAGQTSPFLKDMFYYTCEKMATKIQESFDKLFVDKEEIARESGEPLEWTATEKIGLVRNGLLYIRCTQLLPRIENEEVMGYLEQIYPYMLYSRRTKSTKRPVRVTHKIMDIIQPLRDEFQDNDEAKMGSFFHSYSTGSSDAVEEDALEKLVGKLNKKENEDKDNALPDEVDELVETLVTMIEEEIEEDEIATGEEKDEETSPSSGSKQEEDEDSEEEGNQSLTTQTSSGDDENGDEEETATPNPSSSKKDEGDESESDKKTVRDYVDDIAQRLLDAKESIQKRKQDKMNTLEQVAREPIAENLLNEFLHSDKKTGKQQMRESLHEEKITQLNPVIVNPDIHAHCVPIFRNKSQMNVFTPHDYRMYVEQSGHLIADGAKKLLKLSEEKRQSKLRGQRRGRLDSRRIVRAGAFGAEDVYFKKQIETDKVDMDVMILIDNSGSNDCLVFNDKNDADIYRYEMNRIAAIIQHEMLKQARISHAVWTFEEQYQENVFSPMIDFTNCMENNAGLYLRTIDADGANRDGYALSYAGDYLLKHGNNQKKLLIVISDGQPAGIDGYYGEIAMNDVKNTVEMLEKKGIKTIGIFTGDERENPFFSHMYRNHIFCNNDTIQDMPQKLCERITDEFRQYIRMS